MSKGCTYLPNDIIKLKYNKIEFLAYGRSGVMTALGPSQWKGSHPPPKNTSNCPYNMEFTAKAILLLAFILLTLLKLVEFNLMYF